MILETDVMIVFADVNGHNGFPLEEDRFIFDVRKTLFTMSEVRQWTWLPREAVAASSLTVFKARLGGA